MTTITIDNPLYPELNRLRVHMRPDGSLSAIECKCALDNITLGEVLAAEQIFQPPDPAGWMRITAFEFQKCST